MTDDALTSDDQLFLMVNVRGRSSGLPMNIWIGPRGHARHAARVKVQVNHHERFEPDNLAVVSVEDPPQVIEGHLDAADLDQVRRYIALNRQAILEHWAEQTDGIELGRALRPLP
jgi:hypothetical protein